MSSLIDRAISMIGNGDSIKAKENQDEIKALTMKLINRSQNYFVKLMYLLTLFLDGKEINMLLTTLINKFDNIKSFIVIKTSTASVKCADFLKCHEADIMGS